MPPKNKQKGPSNKTLEKEKKKVVEDKTFGLKNKNKSKVVQQHIKQVTTQVMDGGTKKVSTSILLLRKRHDFSRVFIRCSLINLSKGRSPATRGDETQREGGKAEDCCTEGPSGLALQGCRPNADQ